MAKVLPRKRTSSPFMTLERKTFTVWMKSLVCHGNGCTVFDSNGDVVYRVENYDRKCSSEVHIMDFRGKVLVTNLQIFGRWYGYRWSVSDTGKEKPWFQVKKCCGFCLGNLACQVIVGLDMYWVAKLGQNPAFRIIDIQGDVVAEVKQKQSSSGITLGEDVLTLSVEPRADPSLIMAIVIVYGLINHQL